jgi:hypothetical protein
MRAGKILPLPRGDEMADKIFGAPGCNRSELKLVKRRPVTAETIRKPEPAKS